MKIDINEIRRITELMDEAGLTYFEYEEADTHILLKKAEMATPALVAMAPQAREPKVEAEKETYEVVSAPVVGTVYLSDANGAVSVTVGSAVKEGDVLCRIEAMKMFSDIKSPCSGKVVSILVSEGDLAEYEAPLFHIERFYD